MAGFNAFVAHRCALGALLVGALASVGWANEPVRITGTGSATGGMQLVAAAYVAANPGAQVTVLPALGSAGGISALLAGRLEIALANRAPNDNERAQTLASREYARTPFVLAVATRTGATGVSADQLAKMYSDPRATHPNGQRVRPILRIADAADTNLIRSLSANVAAAIDAAAKRRGMLLATTESETVELIDKIPGGFGPSTLAQILSEQRPLTALALDGKVPSVEAVADGRYPLVKSLYVIHRKDANASTREFLAFLQSSVARQILATNDHLLR